MCLLKTSSQVSGSNHRALTISFFITNVLKFSNLLVINLVNSFSHIFFAKKNINNKSRTQLNFPYIICSLQQVKVSKVSAVFGCSFLLKKSLVNDGVWKWGKCALLNVWCLHLEFWNRWNRWLKILALCKKPLPPSGHYQHNIRDQLLNRFNFCSSCSRFNQLYGLLYKVEVSNCKVNIVIISIVSYLFIVLSYSFYSFISLYSPFL